MRLVLVGNCAIAYVVVGKRQACIFKQVIYVVFYVGKESSLFVGKVLYTCSDKTIFIC